MGLGTGGSDLELSIMHRRITPTQGIHDSAPFATRTTSAVAPNERRGIILGYVTFFNLCLAPKQTRKDEGLPCACARKEGWLAWEWGGTLGYLLTRMQSSARGMETEQ